MSPVNPLVTPNPKILIDQLRALIDNPDAFSAAKRSIVDLSIKAKAVFDGPFDTMRRLTCAPLPGVMAYIGQEYNIFKAIDGAAGAPTSFDILIEKVALDPIYSIPSLIMCVART
ncbi:hypothetical protein OIDMADRAFT_185121 [Oidiodendron maius Zn]|uniref:Uncharacterized protein n=1 Tax=Oidiodendron maius (strain Zn) TaxID=913774 RepID=A0A0C3CS79_OIDMZ|nr:hypothetical protein OIDMADRAFT_185121 [Oidiodendron maius Zn]